MENTNKPQWLLDAEKDINEFAETKYGKMSARSFINSENARNVSKEKCIKGAKISNDLAKTQYEELGYSFKTIQLSNIKTKEHQSKAGKIGGKKNVESGHWANLQKIATLNANEKIECEFCKRMIDRKNHGRWHGDNCKLKNLIYNL